jgi:hypothetical protein
MGVAPLLNEKLPFNYGVPDCAVLVSLCFVLAVAGAGSLDRQDESALAPGLVGARGLLGQESAPFQHFS